MRWPQTNFGHRFFYVSAGVVVLSGLLTLTVMITVSLLWGSNGTIITVNSMDHAVHEAAPLLAQAWQTPAEWPRIVSSMRAEQRLEPMRVLVLDTEGHILLEESDLLTSLPSYSKAKISREDLFTMLANKSFVHEDRAYVVAPVTEGGTTLGVIVGDLKHYSAYRPNAPLTPLTTLTIPALVTIIVSLLASLYLTRGLRVRLAKLTAAIQAMAKGDYRNRLPMEADDEIGQVAQAFNHMADRLQEARLQEQELGRLKRDLITNVSHDLRGPLTSLRGYVEALQEGIAKDPATTARYAKIITRKSEQLSGLVEDLLLYSRLESGHFPLNRQTKPLADWLREGLAAVEPDVHRSGMELSASIPESAGSVVIDVRKMNQVLDNLIRNALRYAPQGSCLHASLYVAKDEAVIAIADEGEGIDASDLPHLFERFYQGRHKHEGVGTGLGLAIAAQIVQAHGGRIWAENRAPNGAVFYFTLPLNL